MSGGAGYVLSREAVMRLVEKAFYGEDRCINVPIYEEDIALGERTLIKFKSEMFQCELNILSDLR